MFEEKDILNLSGALRSLPGKTDQTSKKWLPLWVHLTDTAGVMKFLTERWTPWQLKTAICKDFSTEEFSHLCLFLALTHDLGKMIPVMSSKLLNGDSKEISERLITSGVIIPEKNKFGQNGRKSPHALAGEAILIKYGCPETLAVIVGAHHGKPEALGTDIKNQLELYPCNYYGSEDPENPGRKLWGGIWQEWISFALRETGFGSVNVLPDPGISSQMLLTGLLIMADWIASNTRYFPLIEMSESGNDILPEKRIQEGLGRLNLPEFWEPEQFFFGDNDFICEFGFAPKAMQSEIINEAENCISPGLMIVEAPMGSGKTEAALAAAEVIASKKGCGGLFFGMPTQATANGIFPRLKKWAEGQSEEMVHAIKLAHGMAEFNEDYRALFHGISDVAEDYPEDGLITHEWFEGRKQALLSEFVIGTIDQLLLAALKQKHVMLRHLGLAGKVVILDEVHSFDSYMSQYLERTLNWLGCYKTPVIMLSATLPVKKRKKMVEAYLGTSVDDDREWSDNYSYPLLTWTDGGKIHQKKLTAEQYSLTVRIETEETSKVSNILIKALSEGGCAGVIVNTVGRAQKIAEELRNSMPDNEVILIHSGFIDTDRSKKENIILERVGKNSSEYSRNGLIVVGTQVLEQSLDIDFDFLITDLCPMDLLLQRIGRLHRHERKRPKKLQEAMCVVLEMEGELEKGSEAVYGSWLLQRTRALLPEMIQLPGMISELVQNTYEDAPSEILADDKMKKSWDDYCLWIQKEERKADVFRIRQPEKESRKQRRFVKKGTIRGILDTDIKDSGETDRIKDIKAQAAVRDTDSSLEVLIMMKHEDGYVSFLPWQNHGAFLTTDRPPSEEESLEILKQRLRLPRVLSYPDVIDQTIEELEDMNRRFLSEWQRSPMLRGELVLLLDDEYSAKVGNFKLTYKKENGISYEKMKEGDEKLDGRI